MSAQHEIFGGWKQIANDLGKGVRSVQRYEREIGLPVHRPAGKAGGAVIATKTELDAWVTRGPTRIDLMPQRATVARTNRLGAQFLQIDSEIALTFAGIALQTGNKEKKRRTTQTARRAYDTIMQLRRGIDLSDAERRKLDANLERLKSERQRLGQAV